MKKILTFFGVITLIPTTISNVVACNTNNKEDKNLQELLLKLQNENQSLKQRIENVSSRIGNLLVTLNVISGKNVQLLTNLTEMFNKELLKLTIIELKDDRLPQETKKIFLVSYNEKGTSDETRFVDPLGIENPVAIPEIEKIAEYPTTATSKEELFYKRIDFIKTKIVAISKVIKKPSQQSL